MKKMRLIKVTCVLAICLALIIPQTSCGMKQPTQKTGFHLDTTCTIEIDNMSSKQAEELIDKTFEECERYEKLFSRTIKNTDIYKVNHAGGKAVKVSPETIDLVNDALKVCKETDGLFDITVGKLTALWDFSNPKPKVPKDADIQKALTTVGYENVIVGKDTIQLKNPDTWLELGAIAKGYIADQLTAYLEDNGVTSGVVNLGGNIITIGEMENNKGPWPIGIETPYSNRQEITGKVMTQDQTLVTSGVYERCFKENGKTYHHVLNPKTGYPVETDILGISIKGAKDQSTWCDAYSTTCLLLGSEGAKKFIDGKPDFEYALIKTDNKIQQSKNFNMEIIK